MPLLGNFSLQDVIDEFGTNSKPSDNSLSSSLHKAFGNADSGSSLIDFSGSGQPSASFDDVINITSDSFQPELTVDANRVSTDVRYLIATESLTPELFSDEQDFLDSVDIITTFTNVGDSINPTTFNSFVVENLDDDTEYYIIAQYRNNFISNALDYKTTWGNGNTGLDYFVVTTDTTSTTTTTIPFTATISPASQTVDEGVTVPWTVNTNNIPNLATMAYEVVSGGSDVSPSTGSFTITVLSGTTGTGNFSFNTVNDFLTEGSESFTVRVSYLGDVLDTATLNINDTSTDTTTTTTTTLPPNYNSFTANKASVSEAGDTVEFTVNTTSIPDGRTIGYTITGTNITVGDFVGETSLTGSITISGNTGSKTFTLSDDATIEGTENMVVTLDSSDSGGETSGLPLSDSVNILDTSIPPVVEVYAKTDTAGEVDPNVQIQYKVNGGTTITLYNGSLDSTCNQRGSDITGLTAGDDLEFFTDELEYLDAALDTTCPSPTSGTNTTYQVNNIENRITRVYLTIRANNAAPTTTTTTTTTLAPIYELLPATTTINEGSGQIFQVNTTNVPNGTTLYWTIDGNPSADFTSTQGTVTIDTFASPNATFGVIATEDYLTEGTEVFTLRLRTGGFTGTIVDSSTITVNDTSTDTTTTTSTTTTTTIPGIQHEVDAVEDAGSATSGDACSTITSGNIYSNRANVASIIVGDILYNNDLLTSAWNGGNGTTGKWYGLSDTAGSSEYAMRIDSSGEVKEIVDCSATTTTSTTTVATTAFPNIGYDSSSGTTACSNYPSLNTFYGDVSVWQNVGVIYTNASGTTTAPDGFYADGTYVHEVSGGNGLVVSTSFCI